MTHKFYKYKFRYDTDEAEKIALIDMLNAGWLIGASEVNDGYRWINLIKYY
jgi:hypothetical protein